MGPQFFMHHARQAVRQAHLSRKRTERMHDSVIELRSQVRDLEHEISDLEDTVAKTREERDDAIDRALNASGSHLDHLAELILTGDRRDAHDLLRRMFPNAGIRDAAATARIVAARAA